MSNCRRVRRWFESFSVMVGLVLLTTSTPTVAAAQGLAPDPTEVGPLKTTSAEYRFPASVDPDVLAVPPPGTPRAIEIWARVYRPTDLSGGPFPLLVFLHGNHATCGWGTNPRVDDRVDYTLTGTCPPGYVVAPSHAGYGYLAEQLASWGYIVVSINANRGINAAGGIPGDGGLNLVRGRLILKHLQRLSEWNTGAQPTPPSLGVDLRGTLDFNSVGLLGHSRGGEGVRAAYNQYRDSGSPWPARIGEPVTFQGIFEIGAVDGQTSRVLNADGTVWNQLLPMCDGDVFTLIGVRPFDRMLRLFTENPMTQKSTYTVWGANHNFYNTEWQLTDSAGCLFQEPLFPFQPGSATQQKTGLPPVLAFFRGNVGPFADRTFNQLFNPIFDLPPVVTDITRVDRGFTPSPNSAVTTVFEDFTGPAGTSSYGFPNDASMITITHGMVVAGPFLNHDPSQRAGAISWTSPSANVFFQTNWTAAGQGRDISGVKTLDLRVSRQFNPVLNPNPLVPSDFSIQLASADGTLSDPVQLSRYVDLVGPVGGDFAPNYHPILQTGRIPLGDFGEMDLSSIRGVRLTFDSTPTGAIFVANIRLSVIVGSGVDDNVSTTTRSNVLATPAALPMPSPDKVNGGAADTSVAQNVGRDRNMIVHNEGNVIRSIRTVAGAASMNGQPGIEIELASNRVFPVRNELLVLRIGDQEFDLSRYATGETGAVIFALTPEEFGKSATGDHVAVQYGRGAAPEQWDFGMLDKNLLDRQ